MADQRFMTLLLLSCFCALWVHGETNVGDLELEQLKSSSVREVGSKSSIAHWDSHGSHIRTDFPCPLAEDIAPCICIIDEDHNIDMDCTLVESESQLVAIFQMEFPVKKLQGFYMTENLSVKVLGNVLNGVSFETIDIHPGPFVLAVISDYFFLGSKETLSFIRIDGTNLVSGGFPFSTLGELEKLERLTVIGNNFTWIPTLYGPAITDLRFINGLTATVEPGVFDELLNLRLLGLYGNEITELTAGTFAIRPGPIELFLRDNLIHTVQPGTFVFDSQDAALSNEEIVIDLHNNRLQSLQAGAFPVRDGPMTVYLYGNQLSTIEPGTFALPPTTNNFSLVLWLNSNQLKTFDEAVFAEVLPFTTSLLVWDNPLQCGCDIAWLVLNTTLLEKMDSRTTCADGSLVLDLLPDFYLEFC